MNRRFLPAALWLASGALAVGLVFVVSFWLAVRSVARSNEIAVPDLTGLDLEAAQQKVAADGLVLQVADERHDPAVPSGRIIEQMPLAGSSVRRGRKVKLVLSRGGEVLTVPNLVGKPVRAVDIDLRREGFVPGELARAPSYDVPSGVVLGQVPSADTSAVPQARIHRLVSDGPPTATWVMPDLTGMARGDAERWIAMSGFRRGAVRRVRMERRASDTVVGQMPLAGYPLRSRDVVDLTVCE
jgi:eukaryotic-like serine/threonine-protein kinase